MDDSPTRAYIDRMALVHLVKLCVGADSVADLRAWQDHVLAEQVRAGAPPYPVHTTRHTPARAAELVAGGSLYWVIKRAIRVRQRILGFEHVDTPDGEKCAIVLDPALVETAPLAKKPFQGWRYLPAADAPADLGGPADVGAELPEALRRELRALGAW